MPDFASLPQTLTLTVLPAPLPKNYNFVVGQLPGAAPLRRDSIGLFLGPDSPTAVGLALQDQPGPHGVNQLLGHLLSRAHSQGLWGQSLPVMAVAQAGNLAWVARSNTVSLQLPIKPLAIQWNQQLAFGTGDHPAPLSLPAGQGRRAYYPVDLALPSPLPRAFYVKPDNRLEDTVAGRGFDRFTFWLAAFAVAPKLAAGVNNGEMLAQRLQAQPARSVPPSALLQAIASVATLDAPSGTFPALMWTSNRVVVVHLGSEGFLAAHEFSLSGLLVTRWELWLAAENPGTVWSYRVIRQPPTPIWGPAGLG